MSVVCRILLFATCLLTTATYAQQKCATDLLEQKALQKNPQLRSQFEMWMKKNIANRQSAQAYQKTSTTYKIPVVVHVLHNGEPVGIGTNIPDAQVISQIRVLNEDYNRMNSDASQTPSEFSPVAGSVDIEFVLAKQDPDGLPTTGITRTLASKTDFDPFNDNSEIKAHSYWPSEDYLNIWVATLSNGYLGAAQFPVTTLSGTQGPYDALTDGVVIHNQAFGSIEDNASFNLSTKYNLGRTTTHEVGHYLGLLHIFGDRTDCNTTDYVSDTPVQKDWTFTCPSAPVTQCSHHVMFQNFMDYTDDACMNLFTQGQVERITTVLNNSPRRSSLLTSHGLSEPPVANLDLEAKSIGAPLAITCGDNIIPRLVVRSRGSTTITSAKVSFSVNGSVIETKDFTLNLASFEQATLTFTAIDLPEPSVNDIEYNIMTVNGATDDVPANNNALLQSSVKQRIMPPSLEAFNSIPADWQIKSYDNSITWDNITAPKSSQTNKAMYVDFYDYETLSAKDELISPFYAIPATGALLKFDHAYAMFDASINTETLRIVVSVGCSPDPDQTFEIFNKSGKDLATVTARQTKFIPANETQWKSNGISLGDFSGENISLTFESTNQNGNNLYLDNVQISTGELNDLKLVSVISPGPVFCDPKAKPVISVQNLGTDIVTNLQVVTTVNGVVNSSETISGLDLAPGTSTELTLRALNLSQPTNQIQIDVSNPDVTGDDLPDNNSISLTRIFSAAADKIPLRQNFDNQVTNWTIYSETGNPSWQGTATTSGYKNSLVYKAFGNENIGDESWFVSPVLDLTNTNQGSLFFSTSYARRLAASEKLRIVASEDCGLTYDGVIFEKEGTDLANEVVTTEWTPADTSDWTSNYVSINDYAGKDNVRFAFVVTNGNGNDLYLDNIEFFVQDSQNPPRTEELFSVYNNPDNPYEFLITFNLPEKQNARLVVYNTMGQILIDSDLPNALNQTFTVNLYGQSAGIYIARLLTPSMTSTSKLFVGK